MSSNSSGVQLKGLNHHQCCSLMKFIPTKGCMVHKLRIFLDVGATDGDRASIPQHRSSVSVFRLHCKTRRLSSPNSLVFLEAMYITFIQPMRTWKAREQNTISC